MENTGSLIEKNNVLVLSLCQDSRGLVHLYRNFKELSFLLRDISYNNEEVRDLHLTLVQNYAFLCFLLMKQRGTELSAWPCQNVIEKEFTETLHYLCEEGAFGEKAIIPGVFVPSNVLHFLVTPSISYTAKMSVAHICFLNCLKSFSNEDHESVLQLSSWFYENSQVIFPSQQVECDINSRYKVFPYLFSDIPNWKRSMNDVIYLFKVLSSLSCFTQANYINAINELKLVTNSHSGGDNNELVSLAFYITALIYYKMNNFDECIELLNKLSPLHNFLQANVYLLLSLALSQKGKHHLSVQILRKCLIIDGHCHVAVLFLSDQYRLMHILTAEIQSLELLQEMLSSEWKCQTSIQLKMKPTLIYNFLSYFFVSNLCITSPQVLYLLACRKYKHHRYEESSSCFRELISSTMFIQPHLPNIVIDDIKNILPQFDITDVYKEAAESSMKASKYLIVLDVCNEALKNISSYQGTPSNNRKLSNKEIIFVSEIFNLKARASLYLQEYDEALTIISRVIMSLEQPFIYEDGNSLSIQKGEVGGNNESLDAKKLKILSDLYHTQSLILAALKKFQESLHFSRLAHQIEPGDVDKAFNLSQVLGLTGRQMESALFWLKFRKFKISGLDKLQINSLMDHLSNQLQFSEKNEEKLLYRDIESFKILTSAISLMN